MPRLTTLIIADDLTGALDSVAPFAAVGLDCLVATSLPGLAQAVALAPEVLAVNLGTRELDPEAAAKVARAAAVAAAAKVGPDTIWFKKIDSRMKGPIAAEVAEVVAVTGLDRIVLCPAIPDLGRLVIGGKVVGEGVANPIPVALHLPDKPPLKVPDVRTDADLDQLLQPRLAETLLVGARGLAAALARRLRPGRGAVLAPMPAGAVGFCIGSRDPISLDQVDRLVASGALPLVEAPDGVVPRRTGSGPVLVQATAGPGAGGADVARRLAQGMLDRLGGLKTVVACGGETSAALLSAAGVGVLRVRGEVLPGLPLCHAIGVPDFPALVTKSGGFGQPDTFLRLWQAAHCTEGQPCL
jgi:uncharacterized protein YgbK (DUF1537 family)